MTHSLDFFKTALPPVMENFTMCASDPNSSLIISVVSSLLRPPRTYKKEPQSRRASVSVVRASRSADRVVLESSGH